MDDCGRGYFVCGTPRHLVFAQRGEKCSPGAIEQMLGVSSGVLSLLVYLSIFIVLAPMDNLLPDELPKHDQNQQIKKPHSRPQELSSGEKFESC